MSTTSVMGGIVRRKEDPSLIQGKGIYVDDIRLHGELATAFVRSPFAAASITSIDASAALALAGVHAVYTIDDVRHLVRCEAFPDPYPPVAVRRLQDPFLALSRIRVPATFAQRRIEIEVPVVDRVVDRLGERGADLEQAGLIAEVE